MGISIISFSGDVLRSRCTAGRRPGSPRGCCGWRRRLRFDRARTSRPGCAWPTAAVTPADRKGRFRRGSPSGRSMRRTTPGPGLVPCSMTTVSTVRSDTVFAPSTCSRTTSRRSRFSISTSRWSRVVANVVVGEHLEVPNGRRGPDVRSDAAFRRHILDAARRPRSAPRRRRGPGVRRDRRTPGRHRSVSRRPPGGPRCPWPTTSPGTPTDVFGTPPVATMTTSTSVISSGST